MAASTAVALDRRNVRMKMPAWYLTGVVGGCCSGAYRYPILNGSLAATLGCLQIIFGVLCITTNSVSIHYRDGYGYSQTIGAGIWAGTLFIVSGAFGIAAGKTKTKGMINTFMWLSISSVILSMCALSLGAWQISESRNYLSWKCDGMDPQECPKHYEKWRQELLTAMGAIQVICAILEAVVAIASTRLCSQVVCWRVSEETRSQQFYYDSNRQKIPIHESRRTTRSAPGSDIPEATDRYYAMRNPRLNGKMTVILGVVQIILGIMSIVVNFVSLFKAHNETWAKIMLCIGWFGYAFIISGTCGITAGKTQGHGLIITYMVMTIISAILSICPLMVLAIWQSVTCADDISSDKPRLKLLIGLGAVQAICCLLEATVAIAASVFCGHAVCCYRYKISEQLNNPEDEIIQHASKHPSQLSPGCDVFVLGSTDLGKWDAIQPSSTYIDKPPHEQDDQLKVEM